MCINPKHLRVGTQQDNMRDCVLRNRNAFGERSGTSKLTEKDVYEIFDLYMVRKLSQYAIARHFGINQSQVSYILSGKYWKKITHDLSTMQIKDC